MMQSKKVEHYMSDDPIFIQSDTKLVEVIDYFRRCKVNHLPVVDQGKLVGIISHEDLMKLMLHLAEKTPGKRFNEIYLKTETAGKIMSRNLITLRKSDDREYAVELLLQGRFHSLPVVDEGGAPIGMVTASDLLKGYYEMALKLADC